MRNFSLFAAVAVTALALFAGDMFACGGGERAGRGRLLGRLRERRGGSCSSSSMSQIYSSVQYRSVTVQQRTTETVPAKTPQAPAGNVK